MKSELWKSSMHFFKILYALLKRYVSMMECWENDIFQWCKVEEMKYKAFKIHYALIWVSMRIYAHTLFHFIPIWKNLNQTLLPYSCSIEILSLNDERLRKWNPRLLNPLCPSMRILYSISFQFQSGFSPVL